MIIDTASHLHDVLSNYQRRHEAAPVLGHCPRSRVTAYLLLNKLHSRALGERGLESLQPEHRQLDMNPWTHCSLSERFYTSMAESTFRYGGPKVLATWSLPTVICTHGDSPAFPSSFSTELPHPVSLPMSILIQIGPTMRALMAFSIPLPVSIGNSSDIG